MSADATSWREVSLGEVCELKYGKSLPDAKRAGGDVPVFGSNGVVGLHQEAITDGPAIVVGRKGSFGEINLSAVPCWPIDTTYYIDKTATKADLKWLAFRLSALGLKNLNKAAAVPGLNREDAYRQRLLLPTLAEQRRIAEVLDRAEALRAKRRAALAQLDTLTQAIFLGLFGDPTANPTKWSTRTLRDVCDVINDCPHSTPSWTEAGVICLRTANLTEGNWDWRDTRYVSEATYLDRSTRGVVQPGDIVLSREGTVGVAAIVSPSMRACMGQRLVQLRPSPAYLV